MAKYKQGQTLRRGTVEVTHKGKKKGKPKMLTPEQFDEKAEDYYAECLAKDEAPTIPGLAFHLGFSSRQSMYDYGKDGEYKECTDRARLFIEAWLNKKVVSKEFFTPGQIFILKTSFGYEDLPEMRGKVNFAGCNTDLEKASMIISEASKGNITLDEMSRLMSALKTATDINKVDEIERMVRELTEMVQG